MSDKHPSQAMPHDGRPGAPDGTNNPPERGAGGGGPLDPAASGKRKRGFRGGQSEPAYHGTHRLGEQQVDDEDNPNGVAGSN